ncbi:hypothetical protein LIA77_08038 [Sarocladium implicatum]|nr:hypothetical protein LIA77_08038 [Sarocladium implicatum]
MPFTLYLVQSLGAPRNHHALFIKLDEQDGSGWLFNVEGNIQQGMTYESRATDAPEKSSTFLSMSPLGVVSDDSLEEIEELCRSNPAPEKQFDGPKRIDSKKPLRRCQEWTAEMVELLEREGVLRRDSTTG